MDPNRFQGKVCIVTGGSSGIGRAACERFAAEGGLVVVVARNAEHGDETVRRIAAAGGQAFFASADVSSDAEVRAAVESAVGKWGKVDVVVNNAAMMTFDPLTELSERDWDRVLAVNLKSVFLFCRHATPHMPPGSAVVNTSSVHAFESEPGVAPYAASKGGMQALTRVMALELKGRKIRVNCVAPGAVDTPMLWDNPNVKSGKEQVTGAVGKPEDIAAAICFLAADEARFVNGTTLVVDGGRLDVL